MMLSRISDHLRWSIAIMAIASAALGAPVERDLGAGLMYVRVHALPGDLPPKPSGRVPACVVDVRYVEADDEAAATFSAWVKARATPRTPVFVLANADTATALLNAIAGHGRGTGIVTVGIERGAFRPDVAAKGSADDERRAYDAFEKGASPASLLADNPQKVRNDEASLSKDRVAEASAEAAENAAAGKQPSPVDVTLQRAVHLHRALVALKRI